MARRDATNALEVNALEDKIIYAPRSYQKNVINSFMAGKRRFVTVWHRRAGKDRTWLAITLMAMLKRKGVYFHIFPSLNQGRRDIWDNLVDGVPFIEQIPRQIIKAKNETEMQITLTNGSIWQIMGADDLKAIARLRGPNPVGLVFSEYGTMLSQAWETLSPVLAENNGWAAFAYTPPDVLPGCCSGIASCQGNHGKAHYLQALDNPLWYSSILDVEQTVRDGLADQHDRYMQAVVPQAVIEQERREGRTKWYVNREYYCSFDTPVENSYYGDLLLEAEASGRVCHVPYDPAVPVHTAWDLGAKFDTMAIGCVQVVGPEIRWIDALSGTGQGMPHYVHELKERRRYVYDRHYLPHDIMATEIASGNKRFHTLRSLGLRIVESDVQAKLPPMEGIEVVRRLFPRFWFDKDKCAPLVAALRNYHEANGVPAKDGNDHYADMVRTFALAYRDVRPGPLQRVAVSNFDPLKSGPPGNRYRLGSYIRSSQEGSYRVRGT